MTPKSFTRMTLAVELKKRTGVPFYKARKLATQFLAIMADTLAEGERIEFRGLGLFEPVIRKPRVGRNPRDPKSGLYRIPAYRTVKFKPSKCLYEKLNADFQESAS